MDPGIHSITIHRGCAYKQRLQFLNKNNDEALDLTNYGPWTCEVKTESRNPLVVAIDVIETDPANGILDLDLTPEASSTLKILPCKWGLMSFEGILFAKGVAHIESSVPEKISP